MPISTTKIFNILCVSMVMILVSCVNLKPISDFSQISIEGIAQFEALSTSFSEVCEQNGRQESIRTFNIHNTVYDCKQDQKADSISQIIYVATKDYFYGLSDLSNNELTDYDSDAFTQALATGDFGPIQLNETDVKAYSDISTLLLRASTDSFRRKKIKEYVTQAHGPLLKLLGF